MQRVTQKPREGLAVQWSGWNEKEIEELFRMFAPDDIFLLRPVTNLAGERTGSLYVLDMARAIDAVVDRGYWFVGHSLGMAEGHVVMMDEKRFVVTYQLLEL